MRKLILILSCLAVLMPATPAAAAAGLVVDHWQISNNHSGRCLDVGGRFDGAPVQQFGCNGTVNQEWREVPTSDGYVELQVASSGKCLQVRGASQADDAVTDIGPCTVAFNQQWRRSGGQWLARHSGKCLSIMFDRLDDRAPAVQYTCDGGPAEAWSRRTSGKYELVQSEHAAVFCLTLAGVGAGGIVEKICQFVPEQLWKRTPTTNGYFVAANSADGRCLGVAGGSLDEGAPVIAEDCTGQFDQQWISLAQDGFIVWRARHSGKCLTIAALGVVAVQRTCDPARTTGQNWQVT